MKNNANWEELTQALAGHVNDSLRDVLEGADSDLRNYAVGIAKGQVDIMREPEDKREALLKENRGQWRALAEINRLRVNNEKWELVDNTLLTITSTALRLIPVLVV